MNIKFTVVSMINDSWPISHSWSSVCKTVPTKGNWVPIIEYPKGHWQPGVQIATLLRDIDLIGQSLFEEGPIYLPSTLGSQ